MATRRYPGGYVWTRDYVCTLFAPVTPSGAANEAWHLAIAAMLVFCVSLAVSVERVSRRAGGTILKKTIQIGGIGSMVYAFFVVRRCTTWFC